MEMNNDQEEAFWKHLSKALFGSRRTTDEGLFTYRVMEQVRRLEPVLQDLAWHRFFALGHPAPGCRSCWTCIGSEGPVGFLING